ncbi:hypothetical protein JTB14_013551 [Gonioctena quinquepunctata]|nr:hypothetical protein JTB14_013551 [Gonioctena quinquepunctata]
MFSSAAREIIFIFLGCFFLSSGEQIQNFVYDGYESAVTVKENRLQCYDCNSEYDPRCGDPFNPYTIGIINCSDRKPPEHLLDPFNMREQLEPTLCRKMVQKVEGKLRVIRGCGYLRDEHDDKRCYRRTGTANVEVFYCACTKSLCNTANPIQSYNSVILTALVAIITMSSRLSFLLCSLGW